MCDNFYYQHFVIFFCDGHHTDTKRMDRQTSEYRLDISELSMNLFIVNMEILIDNCNLALSNLGLRLPRGCKVILYYQLLKRFETSFKL